MGRGEHILKKIVFFNKTLLSGGIEKCIETLSRYIHKNYELEICYYDDSKLDMNIVNILSKYAKITKLEERLVTRLVPHDRWHFLHGCY